MAGGGVRTVPPTSESAGENVPAVSRPGATHTLTEWLWFRPQPSLLLTLRSRGKVISSYIGAVSPGQEEAGGTNSIGWGGAGGACTPCQTDLRSGSALEELAGYAPRQTGVGRAAHAPPGTPPQPEWRGGLPRPEGAAGSSQSCRIFWRTPRLTSQAESPLTPSACRKLRTALLRPSGG